MSESDLVSVICLCYNHEDYVIEALNSVINQDHKNIELIIVDDASLDKSSALIKQWNVDQNHQFIHNEHNIGNTKSFNKALKKASGDYIIDLAADDVLNSNFISTHLNTFKNSKFKNLGVVYSNAECIDSKGGHIKFHYEVDKNGMSLIDPPTGNIYSNLLNTYFISSPSMMATKEVYKFIKGYDDTLSYEDLDFWIRTSRHFAYDYSNSVLVKKRILPDSHGKKFYIKRGKQLSQSTLIVLRKAYTLNQSKLDYKALCSRTMYELKLSVKVGHVDLAFGFMFLYLKSKLRSL